MRSCCRIYLVYCKSSIMQSRFKRCCGWSLVVAIVLFFSTLNTASGVRFPAAQPIKVASSSAEVKEANVRNSPFIRNVEKNVQILIRGGTGIMENVRKTLSLRKLQKKNGITSLSFTEFKFLEQAKDDLSKCVRLLVTVPLSPEFFMYSNIVFPLFSSHNPWAWKSLPSSFDDTHDAYVRERALVKRRMQTALLGLHTMQADTLDDLGAPEMRQRKVAIVERIERALKQKSFDRALEELEPWLVSKDEKTARKLSASALPGAIVKQCLRSFGSDGVPNIPIIRRMNAGELSNKIKKISDSDNFLASKGIAALSPDELKVACFERCISTHRKSEGAMRGELSQWLELVSRPVPGTRQTSQLSLPQIAVPASKLKVAAGMIAKPADVAGDKVNEQGSSGGNGSGGGIGGVFTKRSSGAMDLLVPVTNFQNKRLALMALHAVRDLKTSDFGSVYRAALSDYP